jgi:hypothetical protein
LPHGISADQLQKNIDEAHDFYFTELRTNPEGASGALMGYFTGKFQPGGSWDYKNNYQNGTDDQRRARIFGNFNYGAVLQSFGFSLTFTQSTAGVAQIAICAFGGACGSGLPFLTYPYGDQAVDQEDIKKGYEYGAAKQLACR